MFMKFKKLFESLKDITPKFDGKSGHNNSNSVEKQWDIMKKHY